MMGLNVATILGMLTVVAAHYDGYPFVHKNDGKYGAAYPYANYKNKRTEPNPTVYFGGSAAVHGRENHPFIQDVNDLKYASGDPYIGYGRPDAVPNVYYGGPVHVESGPEAIPEYHQPKENNAKHFPEDSEEFYFLGSYAGACKEDHPYGFHTTEDDYSFVVCDHGRDHRFQCPKGTKNLAHADLLHGKAYGMHELCSINTNIVSDSKPNPILNEATLEDSVHHDESKVKNLGADAQ